MLREALNDFDRSHVGLSKGALSCIIIITRNLQDKAFPVSIGDFTTANEGQVAGLGGDAIKRILMSHGIERTLSSEGGRTSRGNLGRVRAYLELLNELSTKGCLDLEVAEAFWIERVKGFFASRPFTFRLDSSKSLRASLKALFLQALNRQRESSGTMYVGALMQHLVGAKLEWVFGQEIRHHCASTADAPSNRSGDFDIGDIAIHVTTAPTAALLEKCKTNLESDLRPLIITTDNGMGGAKALATEQGIEDRIDVIEFEQFIASNLFERGGLSREERRNAVAVLLERYNCIVDRVESDPSLRIDFET